jgi:UDP-N-acetylmuramoyl-tripeptide--D-alanyl-D-alanine ligase
MKQRLSLIFLYYLRFFARLQLSKLRFLNPNLKIVGITGSAGKTSCLLACEAALTPNLKVKINYGGNSETGLPLSILDIKTPDFTLFGWLKIALLCPFKFLINWRNFDVLLLEMGIDSATSPKNMDFLLSIVQPDIGIFLNVSSVHLMNFKDINQIAQEKAKLTNSASVAIINPSDPLVTKYTSNNHTINIKPTHISFSDQLLPQVFDITFGAAIALAEYLKTTSPIANLQKNFHLPPGRSSSLPSINDSNIIDSSYNSSPFATAEMLKLLSVQPKPRIAVLSDMRELGKATKKEHLRLYPLALKSCDLLITVGPETKKYFGPKAIKFDYWWQAADYLKQNLLPHSTILVKGSQNTIYLEELVKSILKNPSDASRLCRQSPYWQQVKTSFKNLRSI